jgi:hypothetical protein
VRSLSYGKSVGAVTDITLHEMREHFQGMPFRMFALTSQDPSREESAFTLSLQARTPEAYRELNDALEKQFSGQLPHQVRGDSEKRIFIINFKAINEDHVVKFLDAAKQVDRGVAELANAMRTFISAKPRIAPTRLPTPVGPSPYAPYEPKRSTTDAERKAVIQAGEAARQRPRRRR